MEVKAGEVVALVGVLRLRANQTLVKDSRRRASASSGTVEFCGREVAIDSPGTALELGIATVFQDLALCENLDVVAISSSAMKCRPGVSTRSAWKSGPGRF